MRVGKKRRKGATLREVEAERSGNFDVRDTPMCGLGTRAKPPPAMQHNTTSVVLLVVPFAQAISKDDGMNPNPISSVYQDLRTRQRAWRLCSCESAAGTICEENQFKRPRFTSRKLFDNIGPTFRLPFGCSRVRTTEGRDT